MRINILAGGPSALWPEDIFQQPGEWIGADRGAWHLIQNGITPLEAIGDFDSMQLEQQAIVQEKVAAGHITHVRAEKDETDTELALMRAATYEPDEIHVFGVTGGRIDHLLSNIWILTEAKFDAIRQRVTVRDKTNQLSFFNAGRHVVQQVPGMTYLGFMPMGPIEDFVIEDAKYPLQWTHHIPKMWSSNEFVSKQVHISMTTGIVLAVQSRD
jgi:thiamine pyrophosphokinase